MPTALTARVLSAWSATRKLFHSATVWHCGHFNCWVAPEKSAYRDGALEPDRANSDNPGGLG
jgi:hypothetical protein